MNMLGFNSEASLYRTSALYLMTFNSNETHAQAIEMSKMKIGSLSGCLNACSYLTHSLNSYVVCSDFCHCLYETDNSIRTCLRQAIEDQVAAQA